MMRKTVLLVIGLALWIGCSTGTGYRDLLESADAIIEEHPDSAFSILGAIPVSLLDDGEERALYGLLMTEARYKLYMRFADDSLVSYSTRYYQQTGNKARLAATYYYMGAVNYDELGNKEKGVSDLKMAEDLALKYGDELLRNKVFEKMEDINHESRNYLMSLRYAKLLLESALLLERPELIARSYEHISINYLFLGDEENAGLNMEQCLKYAERCDVRDRAQIYGNYAALLLEKSQYDKAKTYLLKANSLKPFANQYVMLGRISRREGDTLQARLSWEKVLTFDNPRFIVKACRLLSDLYSEQGNYQAAHQMLNKADSVNDAYYEQLRTAQLTDIQQKYDNAVMERELTQRKNRWLMGTVVLLGLLSATLSVILWYRQRVREYKGVIKDKEGQISDSQRQVDEGRRQMERLKDSTAYRLARGRKVYEAIVNREILVDFSKAKEQDFVDFYAYSFPDDYADIAKSAPSPTLRQATYLILRRMGLGDKDIQAVLSVSASTIRNYHRWLHA